MPLDFLKFSLKLKKTEWTLFSSR